MKEFVIVWILNVPQQPHVSEYCCSFLLPGIVPLSLCHRMLQNDMQNCPMRQNPREVNITSMKYVKDFSYEVASNLRLYAKQNL